MSLTKGWSYKCLEEITQKNRPISYGVVQTGEPLDEGVPCVRVVDLVSGKLSPQNLIKTTSEISKSYKRTILQANDLMFALRGDIGCVKKVNEELIGANLTRGVALIAPNSEVDSSYLYWQIQSPSFRREMMTLVNGSALQEIPIKSLRKVQVPVAPKDEQKKIAEILSTWDKAIESADHLMRAASKQYKNLIQRLIIEMPTSGSVEVNDLILSDVCRLAGGAGFPEIHQRKKDGTHLFVKVSDMNHLPNKREIIMATNTIDEGTAKELRATFFPPGSTIFPKVGAALLTNKRRFLARPTAIDNNCMAAIPDTEKIVPWYLYHFLLTVDLARFVQIGALPSVNQSTVGNIQIVLPNLDYQRRAADGLLSAARWIDELEKRKEFLIKQKQGLMQKLLTGKVRVKV